MVVEAAARFRGMGWIEWVHFASVVGVWVLLCMLVAMGGCGWVDGPRVVRPSVVADASTEEAAEGVVWSVGRVSGGGGGVGESRIGELSGDLDGVFFSAVGWSGIEVVRWVAERYGLEVVLPGGDDSLGGVLTLRVHIRTMADLRLVVGAAAEASGRTVVVDGRRLVFGGSGEEAGLVERGVWVGEAAVDAELLAALAETLEVECRSDRGLVVCLGGDEAVGRVAQALERLGRKRGGYAWRFVVGRLADVRQLVDTLGLTGDVAVVGREGGVVLVSASAALLESLGGVLAGSRGCQDHVYRPRVLTAAQLVGVLGGMSVEWCERPALAGRVLVFGATAEAAARARARLEAVDRVSAAGLVNVLVWDGSGSLAAGTRVLELLRDRQWGLDAVLGKSSLEWHRKARLRRLTIAAGDGDVVVGSRASRRVEGGVAVQGDTIVRGVETETTGFSATLRGRVGDFGWAGEVLVQDDVSEDGVVVGVSCTGARVEIRWGEAAIVCAKDESLRRWELGFREGFAGRREASGYLVLVHVQRQRRFDAAEFEAALGF